MSEQRTMVSWAEGGKPDREVKRACNRCYGSSVSVSELETIEVVSQYGTAHVAADPRDHRGGHTRCGIDATGESWWWHE